MVNENVFVEHSVSRYRCATMELDSLNIHRLIFILGGAGLLAAAMSGTTFNPLEAPILAALVILFLGVPHGAFDVALWKADRVSTFRGDLALMLLRYVSLAACFFGFWVVAPELALPAFLAVSIHHFSADWEDELDLAPRLIIAAAIITAPAGLHREEVVQIFSWLAPEGTARLLGMAMGTLAVALLQASGVVVVLLATSRIWVAAELIVILALAWLTPPLLFFLVYFCCLHSVRHMIKTQQKLKFHTAREFLLAACPYAPLAVVGTVLAAVTLSTLPLGPAVLSTIFIALGSLTIPHIIVVDAAERHAKR